MRPAHVVVRQSWPRIRVAARWVWFIMVTFFVVAYVRRNGELITGTLGSIDWSVLTVTAAVTVVGKVTLSAQCGAITSHLGHRFAWRQTFWMYSASDVVKYVPGGIWNAVARVKLYADAGLARGTATRAFALEKFWQVLGAVATGVMALAPLLHRSLFGSDPGAVVVTVEVALVLLLWTLLTWFGAHRITGVRPGTRLVVRSMVEQIVMAVALGAGLAIPLAVVDAGVDPLTAVGAFSIGRGVGYVAVFAPAGIGVREVVTIWALGRGIDTDLALVALGVNRVMTFVADLGSFGAGVVIRRRGSGLGTLSAEEAT